MTTTNFTKVANLVKNLYTSEEKKFIAAMGWSMLTTGMLSYDIRYMKGGSTYGVEAVEITNKAQKAEVVAACEKKARDLRRKIAAYLKENGHETIAAYFEAVKEEEKKQKAARRRVEAIHRRAERNQQAIIDMLRADGNDGLWDVMNNLRTGEHTGSYTAEYSKENGISYYEEREQYSSRCTYIKVTRFFGLKVRRGYHVFVVGGLITFVKGDKIDREGMACEWVEQGKTISDVYTVKGYLVRGEHIVARSLKEAQDINAEHRAMQMARLLSARKRAERRSAQKANGSLKVTFSDSINAGNCRPGTTEFKHKYEEAIGHEAKSISVADLRKYGRLFGVEYYAEKAIDYAINH